MDLEDRIVCFAARCVKVCSALPVKAIGSASFADQLFRSATSIAANYARHVRLNPQRISCTSLRLR